MSVEPSALLEMAYAIVADQQARMRALIDSSQQRAIRIEHDLRQSERLLDEATTQLRFASDRSAPVSARLVERERELRVEHDRLQEEQRTLRHAVKQLEQFVRQIDMSSTALNGSEGDSADPWAQALRSQVIMGREEERIRLAREVHDGPAQVLANVLMGLEHSRTLLSQQRVERLNLMLDQMRESTHEGLKEVRRFIADLRPGKLDEQGLVAALRDYIRRYGDSINPQTTFEADDLPRLPTEVEIVLYRIVQESLQNAHKHARGVPVHVSLLARQGSVQLIVRDEGPGFDPRVVARRAGRESWGLTSMRERAELIGARYVVSSRPGHGTEVSVVLPLQR